jgi:hypothetical protein
MKALIALVLIASLVSAQSTYDDLLTNLQDEINSLFMTPPPSGSIIIRNPDEIPTTTTLTYEQQQLQAVLDSSTDDINIISYDSGIAQYKIQNLTVITTQYVPDGVILYEPPIGILPVDPDVSATLPGTTH